MSDHVHECETVHADQYGRAMLDRYRVPGGWIYALYREAGANDYVLGCFVPDMPEGSDAPRHVCGHGYAATSCGPCNAGWRVNHEPR